MGEAVEVAVGEGVAEAVDVAVTVGAGVSVGVGVGVGEADADAVLECDGDGFAGVTVGAVESGPTAGPWPAVVGWLAVGDALTGASALPVGSAIAGALLVTDPPEARTASTECGAREPWSARTVTTPADATAITMPTVAAIRASARARCLGGLIACGKPFEPNGPARRATSRRYASVSWLLSEHSSSTSSRNQGGRTASGAMPNNAAARSVPRLRLSQTSH